MATTATQSARSKPKKPREKDKDKEKEQGERLQLPGERLKLVVRRLPPNLPEDVFWQSVSNWVTDETVTWKAYFPGKPKKRINKEHIPSRAYIAFKDPGQSLIFGREYDGHKFVDKAGNESYAVVEFAPFQKIPSEKKKPDARNATIEKDEDYISFLESLNALSNSEPISLEALIASTQPPSPPKTTPLLEALKAERQAQKDKEAIIRNHPHYKDTMNASAAVLRREEKRRAAAAAKAEATTSGKKGKKGASQLMKQIQIQAKPAISGIANASANTNAPLPTKPLPSPAKSGRGSRQHAKNPATVPATPAATVITTAAADAPPIASSAANASDAPLVVPAKRERPVLGLGSRHFEAALNGAGVTPTRERRRREKGVDPASSAAPGSSHSATTGGKSPPVSPPKRPPRHRKDGAAGAGAGGDVAAVGGELKVTPVAVAAANGTFSPPGAGRGGRRGRGGVGGRGRGGPPRGG